LIRATRFLIEEIERRNRMKIGVYGVHGYFGEFDVEQLCGAREHIIDGGIVDVEDKRFKTLQICIDKSGSIRLTVDNSGR
jgi:hypothetical protein